MVHIQVEYIERYLPDDGPHETDAPTKFEIETQITNVRELKEYLAFNLNLPVSLPPQDQILEHNDKLLFDEDTKLDTLARFDGELQIFMYRKLPNHRVEVHIQITGVVGLNQQSLDLSVTTDFSIARLKTEIHLHIGVPPQNQLLTTHGFIMEDNRTLGEFIINLYGQVIVLKRVEVAAAQNNEVAGPQNNEVAAAEANN